MRVDCLVLGGQSYSKDGQKKTYLQLVVPREGANEVGYDFLGNVILDGDRLQDFEPMNQIYSAEGSFQRFGDTQQFRIRSIS